MRKELEHRRCRNEAGGAVRATVLRDRGKMLDLSLPAFGLTATV
jgi:hypothetical protein